MTSNSRMPRREIILLAAAFLVLLILQGWLRMPPFGDEADYLGNVAILQQYGFGKEYLVRLIGSAGPLYSMVHWVLMPLTHLEAPYIRFVNSTFMAGAIFIFYQILSSLHFPRRFFALYVMAIPMAYVCGGMALTEMPALFFFSLAMLLLLKEDNNHWWKRILLSLTAGASLGFAIIGRQPYLLTLAALPVLYVNRSMPPGNIWRLLLTLFTAVLLPMYVFNAWHGLVPTIESQLYKDIARAGISYRPDFFLLCVFYIGVGMLLVSPHIFTMKMSSLVKWAGALVAVIICAVQIIHPLMEWMPFKPLFNRIFVSEKSISMFSILFGGIVMFCSLYFIYCLYRQCKLHAFKKEMLFFAGTMLLIAFACVKITWGFSSRYAAQAIPPMICLGSYFYRPSPFNMVRIGIGALAGIIAFAAYYPSH